jgi:hypothetical protein
MHIKQLWEFPVPSTSLCPDVKFICPGADAWILYEYAAPDCSGRTVNSGIKFTNVQTYRYANEKFTASLMSAYDKIVEVCDSVWIQQLFEIDVKIASFWNLRHYAIYLDSNGLYEFAATGFEILDVSEGELKMSFPFQE